MLYDSIARTDDVITRRPMRVGNSLRCNDEFVALSPAAADETLLEACGIRDYRSSLSGPRRSYSVLCMLTDLLPCP
jgi:hypothetical protein